MKRAIIISMVFLTLQIHSFAQADYKTSVGARLAPASGITLKHFIAEKASLEGIFATRWRAGKGLRV